MLEDGLLILVNLVLDNTARCLNMIILFSIDGWQYYAGRWFVDISEFSSR